MAAAAQQDNPGAADIDWSEDSTEIVTIQDIIHVQQRQTSRNATESHFDKVWGRKGFLNFAYNKATLTPKGNFLTGVPLNGGIVANMSSDWGVTIQYGRNYRLHKTPIANIVNFYIDYTGLDLGVNHFKAEGNGKNLYDSNQKFTDDGDSYFYTPWNLEKYEVNYSMTLGPSVTIAPFNQTNNRQLHFLKLNLYYHIGYHASMLFMSGNANADINQTENDDHEKVKDAPKIDWGHGLTQSFGLNLSWKTIGIGYEHRTRTVKYKSVSTSVFGKGKYEFKIPDNRLYIQLRM